MSSTIVGTGSYLPQKRLTNFDLEKMVETNNDWIMERTGIQERRIAAQHETPSFMGIEAAKIAMQKANCHPDEVDLLIVATISGDMIFPSTACVIQEKMGLHRAVAMDVSAACSGFLYAMDIADQYLSNKKFKKVLLIGAERMSSITDWNDRNTCVLFGDGAGAAVLEWKTDQRIWVSEIGSGLNAVDYLKVPHVGSLVSFDTRHEPRQDAFISMNGREVFKQAVIVMSDLALRMLEKAHKKVNNLKLIIPHQANLRILDALAKRLNLNQDQDQMFVNIQNYGNVSAASIPIALDEAILQNKIQRGDLVMLIGFGAGFTWAGVLLEW